MPPTIQSSRREDSDRKRGERRSELVCKVKYNNTLPDIPFDPKFITYPFESNRYVQYNQTSLERSYKHELLTEHDLGVVIDLINPETYKVDHYALLDQEDERLLEEDIQNQGDLKRSRHHNKNVSWLRKTEYISTEYNRFTQSASKAEAKIGYSIKKNLKEDDLYKDRESQIRAIEDTFDAAKTLITKHYSKPGVVPVDVLPVFPDFEMWKHPCAQVIFDTDPSPSGISMTSAMEEMSQAMIRGMTDESGDQFVAYFLPTEDTMKKRKRDAEEAVDYKSDDDYEYTLRREYNWNVKNKASRGYEETYFFVMKPDGVYYNELETRVRLSKRRKIGGATAPTSNSRLIVKHRALNEIELHAQDLRMSMLGPPGEEEEEEEEEEEVQEPVDGEGSQSGDEKGSTQGSGDDTARDTGAENSEAEHGSDDEGGTSPGSPRGSGSEAGGSPRGSGNSGSGSDSGSADSGSEKGGSEGGDSGSESGNEAQKDEQEIFGSGSSSSSGSGSDSD